MTLPAWAADPSSLLLTEEQYEALPAEVCRTIEIVDGRVVFGEQPTLGHQRVSRNLTMAFLVGRPPAPCIDVTQDTDMRYRNRNPHVTREGRRFTLRKPDISVFRCVEPGARLWSDDVIVAVEITSSGFEVDFNDKRAEYAAQGIPVYLIVVMDGDSIHSVEEHRLDWSGRNYQLVAAHRHWLGAEFPEGIKLDVSFADLERI
jgi:Uma2 family endonuclease